MKVVYRNPMCCCRTYQTKVTQTDKLAMSFWSMWSQQNYKTSKIYLLSIHLVLVLPMYLRYLTTNNIVTFPNNVFSGLTNLEEL